MPESDNMDHHKREHVILWGVILVAADDSDMRL